MAKLNEVILRDVLANRPAAGKSGRLFYQTDGTPGWYRDNGSSWDASDGGGGLADQGTATYLDWTVAAAPATPAAGKVRTYAKTGKTFAQKDDTGAETVFGAGGGGTTVNKLGRTTVGGTATAFTAHRLIMRKVTAPSAGVFIGIAAYLALNSEGAAPTFDGVFLASDNSGVPRDLYSWQPAQAVLLDSSSSPGGMTARWVTLPISHVASASGDFWVGMASAHTTLNYYRDNTGGATKWVNGTQIWQDLGWAAMTDEVWDVSMHALFVPATIA